jgi:hypothetical protein
MYSQTFDDLIIRREDWGAMSLAVGKPYFPHVPTKVFFHHYGFPEDKPNANIGKTFKGAESIRDLQKENIEIDGLIDIKFHYIIAPNGLVYEGRPSQYMGKHVLGYDNGSIGVLVYGNFNVEPLSFKIKESIVGLLLHLRKKHITLNIPKEIYGHCCKKLTTCPGHNLYQYISKLRIGRC